MTRSIIIIGVFVSMVEQISEFVLCEFPKSVAAKKLKILILPFKMSKKAQSKSAKCQKCSLPPKSINRFLFFRTWFQSSFPSPYTLRFHQLWHVLLRTRDLPGFVIVIKWIIIVFVYIIFFNDGTCICIVSVDFKTFRFALSFGWTSNLQSDSKVMQLILIFSRSIDMTFVKNKKFNVQVKSKVDCHWKWKWAVLIPLARVDLSPSTFGLVLAWNFSNFLDFCLMNFGKF